MAVETLHPYEDGQVVREIIPGGYEERQYLLYPNSVSATMAQRLEKSRFVPRLVARMMDDGMPVSGSILEGAPGAETPQPPLLHETIKGWAEQITSREVSRAA